MKPEAQRIAIAEACGWKIEPWRHDGGRYERLINPSGYVVNNHYAESWRLPDYLNDLNAMHEAINNLAIEKQWRLFSVLAEIVDPNTPAFLGTAQQYAEAFLKTLGLWKDEE